MRFEIVLSPESIRVFYDVADKEVQILVIVSKGEAQAWLDTEGEAEP